MEEQYTLPPRPSGHKERRVKGIDVEECEEVRPKTLSEKWAYYFRVSAVLIDEGSVEFFVVVEREYRAENKHELLQSVMDDAQERLVARGYILWHEWGDVGSAIESLKSGWAKKANRKKRSAVLGCCT